MNSAAIIDRALEELGVIGTGQQANNGDTARASSVLSSVKDTLSIEHGITVADTATDGLGAAVAKLLAAEMAPSYGISYMPSSRAVMKVRSYVYSDDRENPADVDEDGTVTEAEADAYARAKYY